MEETFDALAFWLGSFTPEFDAMLFFEPAGGFPLSTASVKALLFSTVNSPASLNYSITNLFLSGESLKFSSHSLISFE